jgi:hypothetical protein
MSVGYAKPLYILPARLAVGMKKVGAAAALKERSGRSGSNLTRWRRWPSGCSSGSEGGRLASPIGWHSVASTAALAGRIRLTPLPCRHV